MLTKRGEFVRKLLTQEQRKFVGGRLAKKRSTHNGGMKKLKEKSN